MQTILCSLSVLFTISFIVAPLCLANYDKKRREAIARYRAFMLIKVKRYYPSLEALSYDEIAATYDYVSAYEEINWSAPN